MRSVISPEETSLGGPECLSSQELAKYCHDQTLPVARREHLMRCEDCEHWLLQAYRARKDIKSSWQSYPTRGQGDCRMTLTTRPVVASL